jgi:methionyl-tRNA formyltransferase
MNFNKKRTLNDNELAINKSIKEHFNLQRVFDNEGYPSFFN